MDTPMYKVESLKEMGADKTALRVRQLMGKSDAAKGNPGLIMTMFLLIPMPFLDE